MKQKQWYKWVWEDGYFIIAMGMSKIELKVETLKHGKLVAKVLA